MLGIAKLAKLIITPKVDFAISNSIPFGDHFHISLIVAMPVKKTMPGSDSSAHTHIVYFCVLDFTFLKCSSFIRQSQALLLHFI